MGLPANQGGTNYIASGIIAALAAGVAAIVVTTLTVTSLKVTEQAVPALSAAGSATVYADSTAHNLQVSQNGGAYSPIVTSATAVTGANPTQSIDGSVHNGVATTFMRSDAAPAIASGAALTSPNLTTPVLGTPSSGTLTNCTGLPEGGLSLTDITTANVSSTAHGFCPKFPNNTTTFLRGDGTYAAAGALPVNSSGAGTPAILNSSSSTITGTGNTIIYANTASGATLTSGTGNTILGNAADVGANNVTNTVAIGNTAVAPTGGTVVGANAGKAAATAARFTAVGNSAGNAITSGADNTFLGDSTGKVATSGTQNVYVGSSAGVAAASSGDNNDVFVGYQAGLVANGAANGRRTLVGALAGKALVTGERCTFIGYSTGTNVTGTRNTLIGYFAGTSVLTTGTNNTFLGDSTDANAAGTTGAIVIGTAAGVVQGSSASVIVSTKAINSATTNDLYIASADTGLNRVAAGVLQPNTGNGGTTAAWLQQSAGSVRLSGNYTNATNGFTNTALSVTVTSGRVYSFHVVLIYSNSTAGEGAQFDFNGGGATSTNFVAGTEGGINDTVTTALTGVFSQGTVTGNNVTVIDGTFEPSSTGTFIVRAAENSAHVSGTLTILRGSYMRVWDMP